MQSSDETVMLFNKVYDETYSELMRFLLSRTGDYNITSDLLQEIYKAFYIRICNRGAEDIQCFKAFLIASATNLLKRHFGRLSELRQEVHFDDLENVTLDVLELEISERLPGIEESYVTREMAEQVLGYLEKKGTVVKRLFVYHFFCGITIKEAAQKLDIKQSDAVNLIYRTIKDIKRRLAE